MSTEDPNALLEASYVSLRGNTNIGGWNAANLDEVRDGYSLHLHQGSGGVYASRGGASWYIPAMAIQSVDLKESVLAKKADAPTRPAHNPVVEQADEDAKANAEARATEEARSDATAGSGASSNSSTLADDVLAEFSEDKEVKLAPKRKKS